MSKTLQNRCVSNLIQQNVYLRDVRRVSDDTSHVEPPVVYPELVSELTSDGFKQVMVSRDYPITRESVKSYADSVDYKQNLGDVPRVSAENLGDITEIQRIVSTMDSSSVNSLYKFLRERFSKQQLDKKPVSDGVEANSSNGEV